LSDCDDRPPADDRSFRFLHVTRAPRLLLLCVLAAGLGLLSAGPGAAATPCWKTLINDWYDGRIDGTYAIPCYQEAINHLPSDVESYSSAADDIRRALQERISGKKQTGAGAPTGTSGPGGSAVGAGGSGPDGPSSTDGRKTAKGPLGDVLNAGSPDHADSVPIPLLVLAGIAALLLAAGSAGLIHRRIQARRVQPPPPSQ
jgi:hypothetical protein